MAKQNKTQKVVDEVINQGEVIFSNEVNKNPIKEEPSISQKTNTIENKTRMKADEVINQGAVINNTVDLLTLKRMYPKRFLADILEQEVYEKVDFNRFRKKKD